MHFGAVNLLYLLCEGLTASNSMIIIVKPMRMFVVAIYGNTLWQTTT